MNALSTSFKKTGSASLMHGLFSLLTLAVGLLGWWLVMRMQHQLLEVASREMECQTLLNRTQELKAHSQDVKTEATTLKHELRALQARIPDSPEEAAFLQQLSQLALSHHISLGDFRPGGIVDRGDFKEITLRLHCTGAYSDLCHWLVGLGTLPRVTRISQLTVAAPVSPGGDCIVDIEIQLQHALKPNRRLASVPKP